MKKNAWIAGMFLLTACTNNSQDTATGTSSDTAQHSGHHIDPATANTQGNTAMRDLHQSMTDMMTHMQQVQPTGDADHDFATLMKHHHQSAVDMSRAQVSGGQNPELKELARTIMEDQQRELGIFDRFLQGHQPSGSSDYGKKAMGMMTDMAQMNMQGGSVDVMFATMMIPHHQDGVKMAEAYIGEAKNDSLRQVAQKIIRTQPREVAQLQAWLKKNGNRSNE